MRAKRSVSLLLLLGAGDGAPAHHSFFASYDPNRALEITGIVAEFSLKSPHSMILLDVPGEDGEVVRYEVEMASLPMMRRRGFDHDSLRPGEEITVSAWPHRTSSLPIVWGVGVADARGSRVVSGEHAALGEAASGSRGAAGIVRLAGRWLAPFPTVGPESPLPLTPVGLAAREAYDPKLSPANTCEPNNVPAVFHSPYLFEIQVADGQVVVRHEAYNVTRTVPLAGEPQAAEPSGVFGSVRGRVEGDTLVIESSGFPPSRWGLGVAGTTNGAGADVPSSEQKRLTERYAVSDDGDTLTVSYVLEDPVYLTEPYSNSIDWTRVPDDSPMYVYDCEVDNAARFSRDL